MLNEVDTAPRTAARLLAADATTLGLAALLNSAMEHYHGSLGRGRNDPAMSGRGSGMDHGQMGDDRGHGMDHMDGNHDMDRGRADHAGGYGRHCG